VGDSLCGHGQHFVVRLSHWPPGGSPDYVDVIYSVAGRPEHSFNRMLFVPQAWTLPVELGFYLLAPFVLRFRTSTILVLCAGLVVGSKLVSHYLSHQGVALDTPALLPFQLQYFLFGVLAYRFYVFLRDGALQSRLLCWSFAVLAFGLIAFGYKVTHVLPLNSYAATVGLYALGALCLPFLFMLSRQNPVDALIGELSYPLYLFHFAIAKLFVIGRGLRWVSVENWGITTLVLTLLVSAIYIMIVDRRIEAIRATIAAGDKGKRRVAKAKPTPLPEPLLVPISVPKD
jgi:peptidoglycan/LPS O-acetylase OafA/YrhL